MHTFPLTDSDFMRISRDRLVKRLLFMCLAVAVSVLSFVAIIKLWVVLDIEVELLPWVLTAYGLSVVVVSGYGAALTLKDYMVYKEHRSVFGVLPTKFQKIEKRELWEKQY